MHFHVSWCEGKLRGITRLGVFSLRMREWLEHPTKLMLSWWEGLPQYPIRPFSRVFVADGFHTPTYIPPFVTCLDWLYPTNYVATCLNVQKPHFPGEQGVYNGSVLKIPAFPPFIVCMVSLTEFLGCKFKLFRPIHSFGSEWCFHAPPFLHPQHSFVAF